ncbi:MAG: hypothetical protein HC765_15190 [Brachymonas sp.]|nr:hypothetical protein [Brachymonas sp.]
MLPKSKATAKSKSVDAEMAQFQADLLQSIRELKAGQYARVTKVSTTPAAQTLLKVANSNPKALLAVAI